MKFQTKIPEKYRKLIDLKVILLSVVLLFIFFRHKNIFFVILFIALNVALVILTREFNLFNPVKVMDFAVFICAYTYGVAEGLVLAGVAFLMLGMQGKFTLYKMVLTLTLVPQAFIAANIRFLDVVIAGLAIATVKFVLMLGTNMMIFGDIGTPGKLIKEIGDFVFWIAFYLVFGKSVHSLMI